MYAMKKIDATGMYRIVSVTLALLVLCSLLASSIGQLAYTLPALFTSLVLAVLVALGLNKVIGMLLRVPVNQESALITGLILFFMMIPSANLVENWYLVAAVALAILSKYLIVYRRQHIVNPAAAGAVGLVLIIGGVNVVQGTSYNTDIFSWWVANPILFLPVLLLGAAVVQKIRKWPGVLALIIVGLVVFVYESLTFGLSALSATQLFFVSFPTLFLAFYMFTEPTTMPPRKWHQVTYGALVGALMSTTLFAPYLAMTPELALVLGNVYAYSFRARRKLYLTLVETRSLTRNVLEFVFKKPTDFYFRAGQYLEWMLPHEKADDRGARRYFTIASSPTEDVVRLALKVPENPSTYKQSLTDMKVGEQLIASQLAGDFLLPTTPQYMLGLIAGGIGITPFRSQLRYLHDQGRIVDTVLFYCAPTSADLAYKDELKEYQPDLCLVPVLDSTEDNQDKDNVIEGYLTTASLTKHAPDYLERHWYLSGPPGLVNAYKKLLLQAKVPRRNIKTDYFPGLA
jgi:ferredoxin-NADP reductase/Na+-translocating ferredoxin:NAD+ oxidoreductase RnfD subunit